MSFYAVKVGKVPGIYETWNECSANVNGFSGAEYKKFASKSEAEAYIYGESKETKNPVEKSLEYAKWMFENHTITEKTYNALINEININDFSDHVDVYVDGSFNQETNKYGYGAYLINNSNKLIISGSKEQIDGGRNVEGEVAAATIAISTIIRNPAYKSITVYYDYQGIGAWADGAWSANKTYTQEYADFIKRARGKGVEITFKHVKGHSGDLGNEYVDKIAKIACGIPITESEKSLLKELSSVRGYSKLGVT